MQERNSLLHERFDKRQLPHRLERRFKVPLPEEFESLKFIFR
jgi:hypothetical protein